MPRLKSLAKRQEQAAQLIAALNEHYGELSCSLVYADPWQLLVGGILAAQCTDARVNQVTRPLFERWPEVRDFSELEPLDIEPYIKSCGLYHNKAKGICGSAHRITEVYGGEVPSEMDELLSLPGVGRKIANLIRGEAFGIPGVVVDTHNLRVSNLLGLVSSKVPAKVETELEKVLPQSEWTSWGHYMVTIGRDYCKARKPQCSSCPLSQHCSYAAALELQDAGPEKEADA